MQIKEINGHTHAHTHTEKQSEIKKQNKTNRPETTATSKEQCRGVAVERIHIKREMIGVGKRKNIYIYIDQATRLNGLMQTERKENKEGGGGTKGR